MHNNIDSLFENLWKDYVAITPSASQIHKLLGNQSGRSDIVNDHIALRTFNLEKVSLDKLSRHFTNLGYQEKGTYNFEQKKLSAKHFEHSDDTSPKVFISELRVEELSASSRAIIENIVSKMDAKRVSDDDFLYSGKHWDISKDDYLTLRDESEYAGWMAAWGYRANHFTVSVNHLNNFLSLEQVNIALLEAGFSMNESGGLIKGGEEVYLAQSSTMADNATATFSDGTLDIPSCFYEFAERFSLPTGERYQGFVAASADKIFESTNS